MIKQQLDRVSVRNYLDKKIEKSKIDTLKKVINSAPTAKNFQCASAIFITDPKIKELIGTLNWNQKHIKLAPLVIVFCADYNRMDLSVSSKSHNFDQFIWSAIDATIACTMCMDAAIELGLGTCFIGGLRMFADQLKKPLGLSGSITPVVGLSIGYPAKINAIRPKINKTYDNKYSISQLKKEMNEYDKVMVNYYSKVFNKQNMSFRKINAASVDKFDTKKTKKILKDQFKLA